MSYPAPTTGIGVAAKINVAGNGSAPSGKQFVPGYNDVTLSLSATGFASTFQLNPEIVDVANTSVTPGIVLTLSSVASSSGNTAVYTGSSIVGVVGATYVVAGFVTHLTNNGTFLCTAANGSTTITLENAAAVAESHAATATEQEIEYELTSVASTTGVYTGSIPATAGSLVGKKVTILGFVTNAVNNGTFTITANNGSTTITTTNTASVSESHAATAAVSGSELTYYVDGTRNYNPANASATGTPSGTPVAVATVSSTGLITAGAQGGTVVEVSFPTFNNASGATGAVSPNPMAGLPLNKIYAEVNVTVVA